MFKKMPVLRNVILSDLERALFSYTFLEVNLKSYYKQTEAKAKKAKVTAAHLVCRSRR